MLDTELQKIIDSKKPNPHYIFLDYNVLLWKVINFYNGASKFFKKQENQDVLLKIGLAYVLNRGPIGLNPKNSKIVVIADEHDMEQFGGYWRHYICENDPRVEEAWKRFKPGKKVDHRYKAGRGDKTELFYRAHKIGKEYCKKYLNFYSFKGFEADDIAGAIRRDFKTSSDIIKIFYTSDRDWCQNVDEDLGYYWATPRVPRPNEWTLEQINNNNDVLLYAEQKLEYEIKHPLELIDAKVENGDLGDNICPSEVARELMDLVNEHPIYSIPKMFPKEYRELMEDLKDCTPNVRLDHLREAETTMKKMKVEFTWQG